MPELALILLFIGPSWIFAILYYHLGIKRHLASKELATLNTNLQKVSLFWSNSEGGFRDLHEGAVEADRAHMLRTFWIMTAVLSLFSFVGMGLLILLFISGKPRLELNTFASVLTRDIALSAKDVNQEVEELKGRL